MYLYLFLFEINLFQSQHAVHPAHYPDWLIAQGIVVQSMPCCTQLGKCAELLAVPIVNAWQLPEQWRDWGDAKSTNNASTDLHRHAAAQFHHVACHRQYGSQDIVA